MADSYTPRPGERTRENGGGPTQHNFALHLVERGMQTNGVAPVARDEEEDMGESSPFSERTSTILQQITNSQPRKR